MHALPAFSGLGDCHLQETGHELVLISRIKEADDWTLKFQKMDRLGVRRAQWEVISSLLALATVEPVMKRTCKKSETTEASSEWVQPVKKWSSFEMGGGELAHKGCQGQTSHSIPVLCLALDLGFNPESEDRS